MRRPLFAVLSFLAGCADAPVAPADGGATADGPRPSTCELRVTPMEPQRIHTNERVTFAVQVTPASPATEVRFALVGDALDGSLSETRRTTGPDGAASVELTAPSSPASFRVRASARCGADAYVDVSVGDRGFGVLLAEAVYRGARQPDRLSVGLYRAMDCVALSSSGPDRSVAVPLPGGTVRFGELPAGLDYVVRGVALGADAQELSAGCAGPVRVEAGAMAHTTLVFTDAALVFGPTYDVALAFDLSSTAAATEPRWVAAVTRELTRVGGDAALLGFELASAVATASPPDTRDRDRAAFETAYRDRLSAMVTTQLARRDAQLGPLFERLGAAAAAVTSTARSAARASATAEDPDRFDVASVRYVLDPETPDVRGDDVEVPVAAAAQLRVASGLRDAFAVDLSGYPLPWNVLARSALGAWLARQGVTSSAEHVSLSVCPVFAPIVRGATARCDDACVMAACRRAVGSLGTLFENAIATDAPARALVDLRLTGAAASAAGTLAVGRLTGVATGGFREESTSSVAASALLNRVEPTP